MVRQTATQSLHLETHRIQTSTFFSLQGHNTSKSNFTLVLAPSHVLCILVYLYMLKKELQYTHTDSSH